MATIIKRGNSYRIAVSAGFGGDGKRIRRFMTWAPPAGLTEKQIEKELNRQAVLFESKVSQEATVDSSIKLADFYDLWITHYAERNLKPRTVANYRYLSERTLQALGQIKLNKLMPRHILDFLNQLDNVGLRHDGKCAPVDGIRQLLKESGIKQKEIISRSGLSHSTVEGVLSGRSCARSTADKIAASCDLPFDELFQLTGQDSALSGKTKLHYYRFLSAMLETAVQWQYIPSNPCRRVKAPRADETESSYLDEEEAAALISALDAAPIQYRTAVLLLMYTGLRRGELCGLEWRDIDFEKGVLSVRRNSIYISGQGISDQTPKTRNSTRSIKLSESSIQLLKRYRAWQAEQRLMLGDWWHDTGKLFTKDNGEPMHPDSLTNWFGKFIKRNDLPHVTLHGLRHTNATLLIAAGTNIRTVAARLGHSRASTTANIYAHAIQSADAVAAEALEAVLTPQKAKKRST